MRELDLKYTCGPVAEEFHGDCESRVKLLLGPFGTGKTSSAAWDLVMRASQRVRKTKGKRRSRFAVVRNTYPELRDTVIRTYLDWFPEMYFGKYHATDKRYEIEFEDTEVELLFKALDSPEDCRDLLSLEITGAHIDESREVHEDNFKGLLGRVGRFPSMKDTGGMDPFLTAPQILLTSNYPSTTHWMYRDFVEKPIEGYRLYRQSQDENRHNLRPGYYETLEKDYANRPDLLRTLVRGEWGVTIVGRQVYPEFDRDVHVSKGLLKPVAGTVIRGWDNTGLSPACVVTQLGSTGQWTVLKEFCGYDVGIIDFTEMVISWCNQTFKAGTYYRDYGDPAGKTRDTNKMSPAGYMKKLDVHVMDGIQTFKTRREMVAGRLNGMIMPKVPKILIDPGCKMLIDGFEGGYAYPEIGCSGVFRPEPAKNEYSHIHDALQYPATRLFKSEAMEMKPLPLPQLGVV